jgi:hypothetical protein
MIKFLIIIIVCYILIVKLHIKFITYDNIVLQGFLNKEMIQSMKDCFKYKDEESINCYRKNQRKIFIKLKRILQSKYISVGHARWSNGTKNFDAQTFHRDIKPNILKHNGKYPNVYTLVCFLDKSSHIQGGTTYNFNPGDCMLFNAFNIHKGNNMIFKNVTNRRVIQFFHIFFNENEKKKFYKNHSYAEHFNNDFILKYINNYIDTRAGIELLNLVSILLPMELYSPNQNKYITLINKSEIITKIDGITYFSKF